MKNIAASVRARLMNEARASGRPFAELLQYYGLERFLFRLSRLPSSDQFVLKGALMLRVWGAPQSRPTRDIDVLAYADNEISTIEQIIREACELRVENDGVRFDSASVTGERIKEDADYEGVRIRFTGFLDNARIPMQVDAGFGDIVHPAPQLMAYPTIFDDAVPRLRMYPRESLIAEKFQAMVYLGEVNSRMKDFYDIWSLSRQFDFEGSLLAGAISKTFAHRGTDLVAEPVALTHQFMAAERSRNMWRAFIKRSALSDAPVEFDEIRGDLHRFLVPVAAALAEGRAFDHSWEAPGPWRPGAR